ncbi:Fic family protein [Escherichia coli]|uniref:Fic family protein n=1 Tax=Escherichia coli TaxID=562 RepID=A0A3S4JVH9_ECOLX|nr:Fic family protein [Escherichia coli]
MWRGRLPVWRATRAIQRINYCNEAGEQAGFNITR